MLSSGRTRSVGPLHLVSTGSKTGSWVLRTVVLLGSTAPERRRGRGGRKPWRKGTRQDVTGPRTFLWASSANLCPYPLWHIPCVSGPFLQGRKGTESVFRWVKKGCHRGPSFVLDWDMATRCSVTSVVNVEGGKRESHRGRWGLHLVTASLLSCNESNLSSSGPWDVWQPNDRSRTPMQTA